MESDCVAKRYPEEMKQVMVGKYEGGSTAKTICAEYGVSRSTLLLWAKQYSPDRNGQIPREQYLMRKELERLRIENQIYKECGCSANSSLGTRLECYTTGQRRGLGVSADRPLYVLRKDAARNEVVLGDEGELYSRTVWAENFNWVSSAPTREPLTVTAKTRYSQNEANAVLYQEEDGLVRVEFAEPQRAVTAGQALVAYQGEAVVGGGTICRWA